MLRHASILVRFQGSLCPRRLSGAFLQRSLGCYPHLFNHSAAAPGSVCLDRCALGVVRHQRLLSARRVALLPRAGRRMRSHRSLRRFRIVPRNAGTVSVRTDANGANKRENTPTPRRESHRSGGGNQNLSRPASSWYIIFPGSMSHQYYLLSCRCTGDVVC